MSTTISVTGTATIRHRAELGTATFSIQFEDAARDRAFERTSAAHSRIVTILEEFDSAQHKVHRWSAERMRVWGHRPWNQEGKRLPMVYTASSDVSATFADFESLSSFLADLAVGEGITIHDVSWSLTDETHRELTEKAQRAAVKDAVERASVYADALGRSGAEPIEIADAGMLSGGLEPPIAAVAMRNQSADALGAAPPDFHPELITVSASVQARFDAH